MWTSRKLRQDNIKEFLSEQFKLYCLDAGILQEKTISETPQQNGLARAAKRYCWILERFLLLDSELPKMMWGRAIFHAARLGKLVVRIGEERCPAELMWGIKSGLPIDKLSISGGSFLMRKRDRGLSNLETKACEGKLADYTEIDNGHLLYVLNTRKMVEVWDVIIKESEVGSIPNNAETPDILDEGSRQLGSWHPDDGHPNNGSQEKQGTSALLNEEWHDTKSVNTQETTLKRDVLVVQEATIDEGSAATRESLWDSQSLENIDTEISQSETIGFNEESLEQAERAEPTRGTPARIVLHFFWRSQDPSWCD